MNRSFKHLSIYIVLIAIVRSLITVSSYTSVSSLSDSLDSVSALQASILPAPAVDGLEKGFLRQIVSHPFNIISLLIFVLAVTHTLFAGKLRAISKKLRDRHLSRYPIRKNEGEFVSISSEIFGLLGQIEVIFGLWTIPLIIACCYFYDWHTVMGYLDNKECTEPLFIVVIISLACTRPIVAFANKCLNIIARLGGNSVMAWWLTILTVGPLLGSFITEPGAMVLCTLLLGHQFYRYNPSRLLAYATLGLLFANVSVKGMLTYMIGSEAALETPALSLENLRLIAEISWKAFIGIALSNGVYWLIFRRELVALQQKTTEHIAEPTVGAPIPWWVTGLHLLFMILLIVHCHYPLMFMGTLLLFLGLYQTTSAYQDQFVIRTPVLIGVFLGGLVINVGLQGWWMSPMIVDISHTIMTKGMLIWQTLTENTVVHMALTTFANVKATMIYAFVAWAVAYGGLTIITLTPNPAQQALYGTCFKQGISSLGLFFAALVPTIITALCWSFLLTYFA